MAPNAGRRESPRGAVRNNTCGQGLGSGALKEQGEAGVCGQEGSSIAKQTSWKTRHWLMFVTQEEADEERCCSHRYKALPEDAVTCSRWGCHQPSRDKALSQYTDPHMSFVSTWKGTIGLMKVASNYWMVTEVCILSAQYSWSIRPHVNSVWWPPFADEERKLLAGKQTYLWSHSSFLLTLGSGTQTLDVRAGLSSCHHIVASMACTGNAASRQLLRVPSAFLPVHWGRSR